MFLDLTKMNKIKLILFLNLVYLLPLSAQRYTGYGRGLDWGGGNIGFLDYLFPVVLVIIIIIVGILTILHKIKNIISKLSSYGIFNPSMTPLSKFIKKHGNIKVQTYITEETGEYLDFCVCTNYKGKKTFIGFSAYLGKLTQEEIMEKINKLFINHEEEGCYFLCSIKSEEERKNPDKQDWVYYEADDEMKYHLKELNIKHNLLNYKEYNE